MATNTNASEATNNASDTESDKSNNDDDLDIDDCICLYTWKEVLLEQESMKEFMESIIERHPSIIKEAVRLLETKNEEATREINQLITDICEKCKRMHCTIDCNDCNTIHGCNTNHHHDLE